MSKETDYLKLFKYDKETDDFNTTTFNIQQCLNNNWDKIDVNVKNNATDIGDKSALETINKTNLVGAINELFTNANNGKSLIANVVGNPLLATDTFQQQHDKIQTLKNTFATNLTNKEQSASGTESLNNLINKVANINVGKRWASGTAQINSEKNFYFDVTNTTESCLYLSLDLEFVPSFIMAYLLSAPGGIDFNVFYNKLFPISYYQGNLNKPINYLAFSNWDNINSYKSTKIFLNNGKYELPCRGNPALSMNWIAIE